MFLSARAATLASRFSARKLSRSFLTSESDRKILSDDDQQGGRRKDEIDNAKEGLVIHSYNYAFCI